MTKVTKTRTTAVYVVNIFRVGHTTFLSSLNTWRQKSPTRANRPSFSATCSTDSVIVISFRTSLVLLYCGRSLKLRAGQEGLEPPTGRFGDGNSSQLSYCPSRKFSGAPRRAKI
ncbi:hypothetical protein FGO68_gene12337 [Halteria grandinella]|uniref:Uncharacterized protein n=1 Tax=Halteria grandinella TaxID=5974 RepID=A0A8J8N8U8_HALGN|nr:hypothetical protein FGO68_gene12337 [Halteria grandinella]